MKTKNKLSRVSCLLGMGLMLAVVWLVSGCQSFNGPAPGNLTSVTITNRSLSDVQTAVVGVFVTHGFSGGRTAADQFTYTRMGSRMNDLAYASAMFNEIVTVKVVVTTSSEANGNIVVGCNAWLIEAANDPVFQDSHQIRQLRKWPYEQLLADVKTQLGE